MRRRHTRDAGFTLLEVMISMAILVGMSTIVWGSFTITANIKERVEEVEDRYHQIRLAMSRMAREISMAYISKNDQMGTTNPRTMFVGKRETSVDDLMFSNLSHLRMRENAKECDQGVIRYYEATDPDQKDQTNLMRREHHRLGARKPGEEAPSFVMIEGIEALHFDYFDEQANEWKESWSTLSADGQPDRLPTKVRIKLTLKDEFGEELTFITATRIYMQDPLWFSTGR